MARKISKDIKAILDKIPENKKTIAKDIIDELIFMKKTLKELKDTIEEKGSVDYYRGSMRESPAVKSYNSMIQRYGNLYKQIELMLPEEKAVTENALANFIGVDVNELH